MSQSGELPEVSAAWGGVRVSCGMPGEVTVSPERARAIAAEIVAAADEADPSTPERRGEDRVLVAVFRVATEGSTEEERAAQAYELLRPALVASRLPLGVRLENLEDRTHGRGESSS